jgi:hypothetical protein
MFLSAAKRRTTHRNRSAVFTLNLLEQADSPSFLPRITGTSNAELIPGIVDALSAFIVEEGSLSCEFFVRWMGLNGLSGGYKPSKRLPNVSRKW